MNVILFGATGMVGQGVLRECFPDPDVKYVTTTEQIGRAMLQVANTASRDPSSNRKTSQAFSFHSHSEPIAHRKIACLYPRIFLSSSNAFPPLHFR
jgi:aspartate-semialdehyde dehydrogenase